MTLATVRKGVRRALRAQVAGVQALEGRLTPAFFATIELIAARPGKIIVTGMGKSGFVGMKIAATLTSLGHHAVFLHPVEALHGDSGIVSEGDVVLACSQSGATAEVVRLARHLKRTCKTTTIVLTGAPGSPLAECADAVLLCPVEEEGSPFDLAPMASTTSMLALGDLLAAGLASAGAFDKARFAQVHPGGSLGLSLVQVEDAMVGGARLPLVAGDAPLVAALREMSHKGFGVVGVVGKTGKLVGIITDGDVRRFFEGHASREGYVATDAMHRAPKTLSSSASLKDALEFFERHKITSAFCLDTAKRPVGILHLHAIIATYLS